jgi:hypothetical protein
MAKAPKAPKPNPNQAIIDKYKALGLADAASYVAKGKFNENKAKTDVIKNIYKLDPALYTDRKGAVNLDAAATKYQFEQPKITKQDSKPDSFTKAITNYSNILSQAQQVGVANLNTKDQQALKDAARLVRDFDSKNLSLDAKQVISNITEASDAIDSINEQRKNVEVQQYRSKGLDVDGVTKIRLSKKELEAARGRLVTEQDTLRRLESTASNVAPKLGESVARLGLSDIGVNIGASTAGAKKLTTGLEALRGENFFDVSKSGLAGKLNVQVTDDKILNDINTQSKNEYKKLYDIGTAATTDLQSQLDQANKIYADLPAGRSKDEAAKSIDTLKSDLTQAQKDTLEAKNLYEGYKPISGEKATSVLSQVRESLRLPEERTIAQIETIDPTIGATVRGLAKQYQAMAETPLAPTTSPETEAFRRDVEQRIAGQVALGSQLGAEEQRQYQQAARAAQTARGNIFGVAPAVEEAVTTGLAGEQRLQARLGAAQGFLASGQTMSDAMARDVGLRNALNQSRLGAAQGFIASGPTLYNLASQRLGTQQGMLNNYLAASAPQTTGGFQATPSAANPYAYVNPNAGFIGAQNAAGIYNTLADLQASQYGSQVGALSRQETGSQAFGNIASGLGSLFSFSKGF